jgi:hypothetical protein
MQRIDKLQMELPFAPSRALPRNTLPGNGRSDVTGLAGAKRVKLGQLHISTLISHIHIETRISQSKQFEIGPVPQYSPLSVAQAADHSARAKSGRWTSLTFQWHAASSIRPPRWTGSRAGCWPGGSRLRWKPARASKPEKALARHGKPEISNTDPLFVACRQTPAGRRGGRFTSAEFIKVLASWKIKISMPLSDCK